MPISSVINPPVPQTNISIKPMVSTSGNSQALESNSAEERAIAASTNKSGGLSRGDRKTSSRDENQLAKRKELLSKILTVQRMNLTKGKVEDIAFEIKSRISSGQNITKQLLDSQSGEAVHLFLGLKDLQDTVDPESEMGKSVDEYIDMMLIYKKRTLVSWANTSSSVSETTSNKDHAFGIQSMLSEASQNGMSIRGMFRNIVEIGGEEAHRDIQRSSIMALASDLESRPSSTDSETLMKSLSALSNMQSITSIYKIAEEKLGKLNLLIDRPSLSNSDYVKITLDISDRFERSILTSYSIVSLGVSPSNEYKFCESVHEALSEYPKSLWEDDSERLAVASSIKGVMNEIAESAAAERAIVTNKFLKEKA